MFSAEHLLKFNFVLVLIVSQAFSDDTEQPKSNKPLNLVAICVTDTSIKLAWEKPKNPINDIQSYQLTFKYGGYSAIKSVNNTSVLIHYNLTGLSPYTEYRILVTSIVEDGDGEPSDELKQTTDVSVPGAPRITNLTCVPNASLYLQWQKPTNFYNNIDIYYISYKEKDSNSFDEIQLNTSISGFEESYVISNLTENKYYVVKVRAASVSVVYSDQYKEGKSSILREVLIKPDCDLTEAVNENNQILYTVVIVLLICILIALFYAICTFIIWRNCFKDAYYYLDENRQLNGSLAFDWDAKSDPPAIPVDEFAKHVSSLHADGDIGFSKEYESIQCSTVHEQFTTDVSTHSENKLKNRYLNILAYDHSRVRLALYPGQNRWLDYINANYIDGFEKTNAYIATQGPLPNTFESFWKMIWEQGVTVIVMITNLVERGRRKCDMYWPKEGSEIYGHVQVKIIKEDVLAMYTVRTMKISHIKVKRKKYTTAERIIHQYHYTNWHDHGTPDHPLPILNFVNKSSSANLPNSGPIVVHCSAGVGRTGTYIVLDAMLKQIRARNEINIYGYLNFIRNQRNYLVQTEEQYIFIHDAILEAITFAKNPLSNECLNYVLSPDSEEVSDYYKQFLNNYNMVTEFEPKDYMKMSASKTFNLPKNRSQEIVPIETSRVHLTPKPAVNGSDYINATWLLGFKKLKEFIITQHPLTSTITDFWQMIWDHNAQTIVVLSVIDDLSGYPKFWPEDKDQTIDSENFKVKYIEESELDGTISRDFTVQSLHDDYELTVRVIQPAQIITEIDDIIQLITVVQQHHLEYQNGPIVVIDELGATIAATFCCLSTIEKQLEYDSQADISIYAKLYHYQRPGIFKTDDYLTLYRGLQILTTNKGVSLTSSPDPYIHITYTSRYTNGTILS